MQINLIPDSSVSSAPAGFTAAVQAAAAVYDQDFPGDYVVNITYGWGTYDNQPTSELTDQNSGAFSLGGSDDANLVSYATLRGWLSADPALASLPLTDAAFPNDANSFWVSSAQQKALDEFTGSDSTVDGSIGFNTDDASSSSADWEEGALCEIGHALGWMTDSYTDEPTILDLFRYSSPGQYEWTGGQPAYFSTDDGNTDLANFSTSFDYTLFTNLGNSDPFNLPFNVGSSAPTLSSLDIEVLDVIGFAHVQSAVTAVSNVSLFAGQSISASSLIASISNPSGDQIEDIYTDLGGGSGYFTVNGVAQADGVWIYATPGEDVQYVGSSPGSDTLNVGLYDLTTNSYVYAPTPIDATTIQSGVAGADASDILWQNASSADVALWNANGSGGFVYQDLGVVGAGWQIEGTGDFNGGAEGVLWRNSSSEDVVLWNANGSGGFANQDLGVVGAGWQIEGTGDFDGTGEDGILWRNTSGDVALWNANGSGGFAYQDLGAVASSWQIEGAGDFNGDGADGVLWRNANGDVALWNANGSGGFAYEDLGVVGSSWQIAGTGDFNGVGEDGILWRNTNGDVELWNANASGGFTGEDLGVVPLSWTIEGIGDFNGKGEDGILWRNSSTGDVALWNANGSGGFAYQDLGVVASNWTIFQHA